MCLARDSGTVVKHFTHNPKIKGSNPVAGTRGEGIVGSGGIRLGINYSESNETKRDE
jgi:hypothetical protein